MRLARRPRAVTTPAVLAAAVTWMAAGALAQPAPERTPADAGCQLVLTEHRSARALLQVPLPAAALRLRFTHSVLGTPVEDHYVHRAGAWHLVEERFEGQGYGLPHAAGPGERLETEGATSRLLLDRRIDPLVVRPLPALGMRLHLDDGRHWLLGDLASAAVLIRTTGC